MLGVDRTPVTPSPCPSLVPGMALRPITRALEHLQQPEARDIRYGHGWGKLEPWAKLAFLELLTASPLAPRALDCRRLTQRLGSLQGPGPLPMAPRLQPTGKGVFLSNARQEEINETKPISKAAS